MASGATEDRILELKRQKLELLERRRDLLVYRAIDRYFPDAGPHRRELYPKHLEFFRAGAAHRERMFIAANRIGKTIGKAYEMTLHLTGGYPDWWEGRRFEYPRYRPLNGVVAGETAKMVRDVIQKVYFGPPGDMGAGIIPKDAIEKTTGKSGTPNAIDQAWIKHVNGSLSMLTMMAYEQKRKPFQGHAIDVADLDEEPPADVYDEVMIRTMTTDGLVMLGFTPIQGVSDVVKMFMDEEGRLVDGEVRMAA